MSFGIQRGLPTYERYAHSAVRNEKRRGADPPSTRIWTAEEVNLLKELNELYKNHRFLNVEISKIEEQIKKRGKRLK
jgi:hypothetical protein